MDRHSRTFPNPGPALFAAQFALSHACWLTTHPVTGWLSATASLLFTFTALGLIAAAAVFIATRLWAVDPDAIEHRAGPDQIDNLPTK